MPAKLAALLVPGAIENDRVQMGVEPHVGRRPLHGLLLTRSGQTLYSVALGNQTLDSVLPIASSTKTPSAAVILSLVDEGRIDLDVPVAFGWWFSPALHPGSRWPELSDQGAFGCTPWIDFDLG